MSRSENAILGATRPSILAGSEIMMLASALAMHAAKTNPVDPACFVLAADGITYITASRKAGKRDAQRGHRIAGQLASLGAVNGTWLTAATAAGIAAGPRFAGIHAMAWAWAAGATLTITAINRMETVRAARDFRRARRAWQAESHIYGLGGTHLLRYAVTRLGEWFEIDVLSGGKRASSVASRGLEEDIAARHRLPKHRVQVRESKIAGRVEISIRHINPWLNPIPHPLFDRDPDAIELPDPASIINPIIIGQDPETGGPLELTLWDKDGGKNIFVLGKRGAAKSTLFNNIREQVTRCPDALLIDINVSKAGENLEWAPLCYLTAHGPEEKKKALALLQLACRIIDLAPSIPRDKANREPTPEWPLVVIMVDEADKVAEIPGALALLRHIASKARSEAITYIFAAQRAMNNWIGGTDVRSQLDTVVVGKVQTQGEAVKAMADSWTEYLPNMTVYGEGNPGVWAVINDHGCQTGWGFYLWEFDDLREIVHSRHGWGGPDGPQMNPELADLAGDLLAMLRADQLAQYYPESGTDRPAGNRHGPVPETPAQTGTETASGTGTATMTMDDPADWLNRLDREMEETLAGDPEITERLRNLGNSVRESRKKLDDVDEGTPPSPDEMAAYASWKWAELAMQTEIPGHVLGRIYQMLSLDGTTTPAVAKTFDVKYNTARTWMERLRLENKIEVTGTGKARKWILKETPPDGAHD